MKREREVYYLERTFKERESGLLERDSVRPKVWFVVVREWYLKVKKKMMIVKREEKEKRKKFGFFGFPKPKRRDSLTQLKHT